MACLAKSNLRGSVIAAYNYLEDRYEDGGGQLFSAVPGADQGAVAMNCKFKSLKLSLKGKQIAVGR